MTAEPRRLRDQALGGVLWDVEEARDRGVGHRRDDDEVTEPAQQVVQEARGVLPGLHPPVDRLEDRAAVVGGQPVDDLVEEVVGGEPEQRRGELAGDALLGGAADELVQDRQGVARRSAAGTDHQRQRGGVDRTPSRPQISARYAERTFGGIRRKG